VNMSECVCVCVNEVRANKQARQGKASKQPPPT
jgi:hypothetical protein